MLISIENARISLARYWWSIGGLNMMAMGVFLLPLFRNRLPIFTILFTMGMSACIGLVIGIYFTFRSSFNSTHGLWYLFYVLLTMEFMFAGGTVAFAASIAGRPDLRWLALYTNTFCMALTLLLGMYYEAKAIGWWRADTSDRWQKKIKKYIDYSTNQISPSLTNSGSDNGRAIKSPIWIAAVGSANIPLFFEYFAGGRYNAIFLAILFLSGVFAYVNLKNWGPSIVRLLLLRKLEKTAGRRFINADLEQIQELRRSFFLAGWLMKDFVPMQKAASKQVNKNH